MDEEQAGLTTDTTETATQPAPAPGSPSRMMSNQMATYYCNCAIAATSAKDISLYLGKLVRMPGEQGAPRLVELFERQVDMTVEQAQEIISVLTQTVEVFKAKKGTEG